MCGFVGIADFKNNISNSSQFRSYFLCCKII